MQTETQSITILDCCKKEIHGFRVDKSNESLLDNLQKYINREKGEFDFNKGLCFIGPVGTGKTALMKAIQTFYRVQKHFLAFKFKPCWQVGIDFSASGFEVFQKYRTDHWFFDELGLVEREVVMHYGQKENIADLLIHERYNSFHSGSWVTHFTTNLSPSELEERYDERTFSRLQEMCNFILVEGSDRRNGIEAKPLPIPEIEKEPTEDEKKEMTERFIQDCIKKPWEASKKANKVLFQDPYGVIYDTLESKGLIKPTAEERIDMYFQEREKILLKKKSDVGQNEWQYLDKYKDPEFENQPRPVKRKNPFFCDAVRNTKERFVIQYFQTLLDSGKELTI